MSTDLQVTEGLLQAFEPIASQSPPVGETARRLADVLRVYKQAFGPTSPDTASWQNAYAAAFSACDLSARWSEGAGTLSSLAPSPGSAYVNSFDSTTHNALVSAANTALAALAAPTNGKDPGELVELASELTTALAALQTTWNGGPPVYSSSQNAVVASMQNRNWAATALAAALGIAWSPAA